MRHWDSFQPCSWWQNREFQAKTNTNQLVCEPKLNRTAAPSGVTTWIWKFDLKKCKLSTYLWFAEMFNYVPTVVRLWLSLWDKNINGADDHKSDASHKTLRPPVMSLVLRSRIRNVVSKSTLIWISEDLASFSAEEEEAPSLVLVALTHNYLSRCQKKHFDGNFLPNNPENREKQSIFLRVLMDFFKKEIYVLCYWQLWLFPSHLCIMNFTQQPSCSCLLLLSYMPQSVCWRNGTSFFF